MQPQDPASRHGDLAGPAGDLPAGDLPAGHLQNGHLPTGHLPTGRPAHAAARHAMAGVVRANTNPLTAAVSDTQCRRLAENIPTLCWIADAQGYIVWYNPRWYQYTGTTPEQMRGWGWKDVHDADALPGVLERWSAAISSGQPFEMVIPIRGADGVSRPFLTRINPHRDEAGVITAWFGVNTDISEQVQAQAAAARGEARLRALADAMPQMVWSALPDGTHDYFNARWHDFTGVPPGAAETAPFGALAHPDDEPAARRAWRRALASGLPFTAEFRLRHRSGAYRWVLARAQPERGADGQVIRWHGTCTDIEEIAQARQTLARSRDALAAEMIARTGERDLFATLVRSTDMLVMAIDRDYTILAINPANVEGFRRLYGVRAAVGDNVMALLAGQPEHQAASRACWSRALAGEAFTIVEARGDPARSRSYFELKFHVLRDEAGAPIGAFQFSQDVTERVRDQAALARAQEALRQSQKLESMGQLTGGVAHDFNNLLTPILGSLDMLRRRGAGDEREHRLIEAAYQSAERARLLVHRLLAFARRQPLQTVPVDIAALVRGLAPLLASTAGPQVALTIELAPELPPAKADPGQLEMAILNLSLNARDAMDGAGALTIRATGETLAAGAMPPLAAGAYVRVGVADTGRGMDEATRARAIEPFFSTKGVGRGTGLGLSMAHGLACQLGGALVIESQPDVGTEVAIWLPRSDAAPVALPGASADPLPGASPGAARGAGRVLLVDDEELVRLSAVDMLGELGFEVREAASAEAALAVLESGHAPDLLITDHLMPGMTGVELARLVMARWPRTRILIISGFAEADGIDPALPRLTKPFVQSELLRHLGPVPRRLAAVAE